MLGKKSISSLQKEHLETKTKRLTIKQRNEQRIYTGKYKHMEICLASLITRQMPIKPTLSNYFSPASLAEVPSSTAHSIAQAVSGRHFPALLVAMHDSTIPYGGQFDETVLIKVTTAFTLDPAISLMGIYSPDIPATGTKLCMDKASNCSILCHSRRLEIIQVATYWGLAG